MELEKTNETVWSIKRKGFPGKFLLRSTEQGGQIRKVSISLEEGGNEVSFNMKYSEFKNFYGIISSFKQLIESPEHLKLGESTIEEIPMIEEKMADKIATSREMLQSIGNQHSTQKEDERLSQLDEGLENLEKLFKQHADESFSIPESDLDLNQKSVEKVKIPDLTIDKEKVVKEQVKKKENAQKSKKKILKETDWDPW